VVNGDAEVPCFKKKIVLGYRTMGWGRPGVLSTIHATDRCMKLAQQNGGISCVALSTPMDAWRILWPHGGKEKKKFCFIGWTNTITNTCVECRDNRLEQ